LGAELGERTRGEENKASEYLLTKIWKQRNLPARGFRPSVMLFAVAGVMTFGFWKIGKGIREQKYASQCTFAICVCCYLMGVE
jgi:hypothetical protein